MLGREGAPLGKGGGAGRPEGRSRRGVIGWTQGRGRAVKRGEEEEARGW